MAAVTVKNIPDELYQRLKAAAEVNRRSVNSEIIVCIEKAIEGRRLSPEELLERARRLRLLTIGHAVSDDAINRAKVDGRP